MMFESFFDEFPDLMSTEVRYLKFLNSPTDSRSLIPKGRYEFFEFFCSNVNCDCKKAIIKVMSYELNKSWAIIRYGWGAGRRKPEFQLDPGNVDDPLSNEFLEFFKEMIRRDQHYAARIEKHYLQFKKRMRERTQAINNFVCNQSGKEMDGMAPVTVVMEQISKNIFSKQTLKKKLFSLIRWRT